LYIILVNILPPFYDASSSMVVLIVYTKVGTDMRRWVWPNISILLYIRIPQYLLWYTSDSIYVCHG
jgi:hypothetical protein